MRTTNYDLKFESYFAISCQIPIFHHVDRNVAAVPSLNRIDVRCEMVGGMPTQGIKSHTVCRQLESESCPSSLSLFLTCTLCFVSIARKLLSTNPAYPSPSFPSRAIPSFIFLHSRRPAPPFNCVSPACLFATLLQTQNVPAFRGAANKPHMSR